MTVFTQKNKIPWRWAFFMVMPFYGLSMAENLPYVFTLNKFTYSAAGIMFLASINVLFTFTLAPLIAWKSDRLWTRFGRRKPFAIAGLLGISFLMIFFPLASSLWILVLIYILFNVCSDTLVTGVYQPLLMEVVPQPQRGRASAMKKGAGLLAAIYVNWFLIRQWDSTIYSHNGLEITGEHMAYWLVGFVALMAAILLGFGLKEVKPAAVEDARAQFSIRTFVSGVFFDRQQVKVYMLVFAMLAMQQGLGAMGAMLMTKQFGYSKETLGSFWTVMKVAQFLLVLPIAGLIADRVDRLKMFVVGISISTMYPLVYWSYIHFVAPNGIPPLAVIAGFQAFDMVVDFTVVIAMEPLVFDYIPRRRMGTVFAGMQIVHGMAKILLLNFMGVFVSIYSRIFLKNGEQDYSAGLLCTFMIGLMGTACAFYFLRERAAGRVIPYGKLEHEALAQTEQAKVPVQI